MSSTKRDLRDLGATLLVWAGAMSAITFLVGIWARWIDETFQSQAFMVWLILIVGLFAGAAIGLLAGGLCAANRVSSLLNEGITEIERAYEQGRLAGHHEAAEGRNRKNQ